jgi:hypothetical protein
MVIDAMIAVELEVYESATVNKLPSGTDVFQWWRQHTKPEGRPNPNPVLSLLAAKALCVPATSASVERVFSRAGLIQTAIRGAVTSTTLETLLFLKTEWDDSLYRMSSDEKRKLLAEWDGIMALLGLREAWQAMVEEEEQRAAGGEEDKGSDCGDGGASGCSSGSDDDSEEEEEEEEED